MGTAHRVRGAAADYRWLVVVGGVFAVAASIAVSTRVAVPSALQGLGAVAFLAVALWLFLSERLEWSCVVLGLYLGCLDGYLKLSTGQSVVSAGRDVLLYAIVLGFLARAAIRGERLRIPPLTGWVIAYAAVVLLQLANPQNAGLGHSIAALRPHLEFLPLFFLGYALMQTETRLRTFFLLLSVCALANGVVAFAQLDLSAAELSSWGPGYSQKVNGTGGVSGRVYTDNAGTSRVRPFGLGGDAGTSGLMGVLALGGALALLALAARHRSAQLGLLLSIGPPLAIITGQGRTSVVAGVVVLIVFVFLATSAERLIPTLAAVILGIGVTLAVVSFVGQAADSGVFDRYKTITPNQIGATTERDRGSSIDSVPSLLLEKPLGTGIGFVGPAATLAPDRAVGASAPNGETGFTFLINEVGIPGLLILLGLNLRLLGGAFRWCRRMLPDVRILVAGMAAGIAGVLTMWVSSAPMAVSPAAPYFWFVAGAMAYWLTIARAGDRRAALPR